MAEINWAESYDKLEKAYVANLPPEEAAAYFQNRAIKAEEEVANQVIANAKTELAAKYPGADLDDVAGKTVTELEAAFKTSQTRNEKAHAAALVKVRGEVEDKVKGLDQAVQAEMADVFKAWGKTRVPPPEDNADDNVAKGELRAAGVNLERNTEPTTFDDMVMEKTKTALGNFLRTIPIIERQPVGAAKK